MIIINNKEIRNTVEQVHKNKDDIEDLQETERDTYTKTEADTKFQTIAGMSTYATKSEIPTKTSDLINDSFVTTDSTQYVTASKIFKTETGASTGASIFPSSGSFFAEKDGTSTSFAPQKISLSKSQSATPFNFQIHSSQGTGHNGVYTFDNSKTGTVAVTSDIINVSGTNDGTNWTTITIGNTTKAIPSGGGGSSIDDVVLDYSTTFPENLPEYLELTQAQYNLIKQHVENHDYNIRLIIVTQAGPNVPAHTILYPNNFVTMGSVMNSDSGFFGKHYPNVFNSSGGNLEFWGTYSIYYNSTTHKYLVGLYKFKVAYTA